MECKDVLMGLARYTIGLGSSFFDMGSDLINGLNFLKPSNETLSASNSSYSITNMTNTTVEIVNETSNNIVYDQVHQIWGTMSIMMIFLPGFVYGIPIMISNICKRDWSTALKSLVGSIFFPFIFFFVQLFAIILTCLKKEVKEVDQEVPTVITRMTAAEAALESTGQLMLQIFTIMNGFPSNWIQMVTITSSFLQIGRSVILQDIETKIWIREEESLSFCQSLKEGELNFENYKNYIIRMNK